MTITPSQLTIGMANVVDDSDWEACANEEAVCGPEAGLVGTGIASGTGIMADSDGAGIADTGNSLIANGVGGTGTGMGRMSSFSGSIGLPTICEIPFASRGIFNKITTKASARHHKAMRIQLVERFVFTGTLLLKRQNFHAHLTQEEFGCHESGPLILDGFF